MTWMLSSTGKVIDLLAPYNSIAPLTVGEIAHSLSTINRFTGHAVRPYSVAEHSLLVADIVEQQLGLGVLAVLGALLHDAHEIVCNDQSTPTKQVIGRPWYDFEHEWEHAFHKVFGLVEVFATYGSAIKRADLIALATEKRDLMPPGGQPWACLAGIEPLPHINLRDRDHFTWQDWRTAFEDRFHELQFAHQHYTRKATA